MEDAYCPCSMQSLEQSDYLRELGLFEQREIAAFGAIYYCNQHQLRLPPWALKNAAKAMALLLRGAPKTRGRSNSPIDRYRESLKHYARWVCFEDILSRKQELEDQLPTRTTRRKPRKEGMARDEQQRLWLQGDVEHLYARASIKLRGTHAAGTAEQVKTSVKTVRKHHVVEIPPQALKALGLMNANQLLQQVPLRPGVKMSNTAAFYELPD